jgi:hypothetical protein
MYTNINIFLKYIDKHNQYELLLLLFKLLFSFTDYAYNITIYTNIKIFLKYIDKHKQYELLLLLLLFKLFISFTDYTYIQYIYIYEYRYIPTNSSTLQGNIRKAYLSSTVNPRKKAQALQK